MHSMLNPILPLLVSAGRLPPKSEIVVATQRLRGAIIAAAIAQIRQLPDLRFEDLTADEALALSGLTGKDEVGAALQGNRHLAIFPAFGSHGDPDKFLLFKADGWSEAERLAVFAASRRPVRWGSGEDEVFRLLPLPPADDGAELFATSQVWQSHTPFVPPAGRHRFHADGRPRAKEAPDRQIARLCRQLGHGEPTTVEIIEAVGPIRIHWTYNTRQNAREHARPATHWPGYLARITFAQPVAGPVFLGNSSHFGLGLFEPTDLDKDAQHG